MYKIRRRLTFNSSLKIFMLLFERYLHVLGDVSNKTALLDRIEPEFTWRVATLLVMKYIRKNSWKEVLYFNELMRKV